MKMGKEEKSEKEFRKAKEQAIATGKPQEIDPRILGLEKKITSAFVNLDGTVDGYDGDGNRLENIF